MFDIATSVKQRTGYFNPTDISIGRADAEITSLDVNNWQISAADTAYTHPHQSLAFTESEKF